MALSILDDRAVMSVETLSQSVDDTRMCTKMFCCAAYCECVVLLLIQQQTMHKASDSGAAPCHVVLASRLLLC